MTTTTEGATMTTTYAVHDYQTGEVIGRVSEAGLAAYCEAVREAGCVAGVVDGGPVGHPGRTVYMTDGVAVRDILRECDWTGGVDGYGAARMIDWFDDVHGDDVYPSRREALEVLRDAYKGPGVDGVGVRLPSE